MPTVTELVRWSCQRTASSEAWSPGTARPTGGRPRRSSMLCPRRPGTPASLLSSLPLTGHLSLPLTRLSALARKKAFGSLLLGSLCPSPLSLSPPDFLAFLSPAFQALRFSQPFFPTWLAFHTPTPRLELRVCDSPLDCPRCPSVFHLRREHPVPARSAPCRRPVPPPLRLGRRARGRGQQGWRGARPESHA